MISEFKLVGLCKPKKATLNTQKEEIFWSDLKMDHETFNKLFDYCKDNWNDQKIAIIEHDGFYKDGTPINPLVINIKEK